LTSNGKNTEVAWYFGQNAPDSCKILEENVKKSWIVALLLGSMSLSAAAQEGAAVAERGKMLYSAAGTRLGAVYRVGADGSAQVIVNGKMVTIPANTLSVVDGKLTTSLSKSDASKLH
jgi:hypothetical protein